MNGKEEGKDRIYFRDEPGRQPGADAQYLRRRLLQAVSREIATRQSLGQEVTRDLDVLEVQLAWWRSHYVDDKKPLKYSGDWRRWSLLMHLWRWKKKG